MVTWSCLGFLSEHVPTSTSLAWSSGLWALSVVTFSCLGFLSEHVPTSTFFSRNLTASSTSKTMCVVMFPVSLREFVFCGHLVNVYFWTPLCYFVAILHLFSQSLSIVLRCVGQLLNVTFIFLSVSCIRWLGLSRSKFLVVSSTSCGWA